VSVGQLARRLALAPFTWIILKIFSFTIVFDIVDHLCRLRVIVFSNPSHSSDTKARAAMVGGAPLGGVA
jgi:hypothetical protein